MHKQLRLTVVVWAILLAPHALRGDLIQGGTGSTAMDGGPAGTRDDANVTTSMTATYQTFCSWIIYGMQAQFPGVNFTFAGYGNIGGLFSPVPSTDFMFTQYKPWVDTDPGNKAPTGFTDTRPVVNQDAGGLDAVLVYTPRPGTSDPNTVNFVQAYIDDINNTGFTSGTIDNLRGNTPFYSNRGIHGTGETQLFTHIPNMPGKGLDAAGSSAWILDSPYKCESFIPTPDGFAPPGANPNCTGGPAPPNDEVLTSDVVAFQTFIESTQTIYYNPALDTPYSITNNGGTAQTWDVLYGGVQWGFTYTNADPPNAQPVVPAPPSASSPEPSAILLVATALAAGLCRLASPRQL